MGKLLALDYGKKRTGVATTDELQLIASGLTTVLTKDLMSFLTDYLKSENVDTLIVGLPKRMNNTPSEVEPLIETFIKRFKSAFPDMPVVRVDERFTSKLAFRSMIDMGIKKQKRRDKALVDEISATLILQTYLSSK